VTVPDQDLHALSCRFAEMWPTRRVQLPPPPLLVADMIGAGKSLVQRGGPRGSQPRRLAPINAHGINMFPQFCPHRPGTVVEQQGMETCDWSISRTAVHIGADLYKMCPYGPRSRIRRLRFSAFFCVSPRKSRYRNDCGPVAPLTRTGTEENLTKNKNLSICTELAVGEPIERLRFVLSSCS